MPDLSSAAPAPHQWNASDYSKNSGQQQKWARELIAKLPLQAHEHILDVGCGDGKVTAELAATVTAGKVLGVDSSAEMIQFARAAFPASSHPNLSFEQMDARELRLPAEFDVVFSNAALHWIVDHQPVLAGMARALKPGGRALLQMGGRGCADPVIEVVEELIHEPAWSPCFRGFTFPYGFHEPGDYRRWMKDAGLRPLRVELIPKDMVHQGAEGLAGWFRTTWLPYTSRLPEARRPSFIEIVVSRYLARHPLDAGGNAHVSMVRLEVEAVR